MNKIRSLVILVAVVFLAAACASNVGKIDGSDLAKLKIGMTKDEVVRILGKPQSVSAGEGKETYTYWVDHGNWRHVYHVVVFKDGVLEEFGDVGRRPY